MLIYAYRILRVEQDGKPYYAYAPQYKQTMSEKWQTYSEGNKQSWLAAYKVLEHHANPAQLAYAFTGTF